MKKMNSVLVAMACSAAVMTAGSASAISSTFDTDLEGWTAVGFNFDVGFGFPPPLTVTKEANPQDLAWDAGLGAFSGNPGGFARFLDVKSNPASFLESPAGFTGDLTGFAGQTFSYEHRLFSEGTPVSSIGPYVIVLTAGDVNDLNSFVYIQPGPNPGEADTGWVTVSTTLNSANFQSIVDVDLGIFDADADGLTASGFGISNGGMTFEQVLADVESIFISFELVDNDGTQNTESAGVDNVNLVPEPSSLALLGLGGLLAVRRRRG